MEHNNSQVSAVRSQWITADAESLSTGGEKAMREGTNYNSAVNAEERKRDMVIDVFWWTFEGGKVQKFVHNNHLKV